MVKNDEGKRKRIITNLVVLGLLLIGSLVIFFYPVNRATEIFNFLQMINAMDAIPDSAFLENPQPMRIKGTVVWPVTFGEGDPQGGYFPTYLLLSDDKWLIVIGKTLSFTGSKAFRDSYINNVINASEISLESGSTAISLIKNDITNSTKFFIEQDDQKAILQILNLDITGYLINCPQVPKEYFSNLFNKLNALEKLRNLCFHQAMPIAAESLIFDVVIIGLFFLFAFLFIRNLKNLLRTEKQPMNS